jgi:hypothetical protein
MNHPPAIVFVPGFFGFGSFGPAGAPIIEYVKFARSVLRTELGARTPVIVHQPPPTGPLSARAASLFRALDAIVRDGVDGEPVGDLHVVGHSTGRRRREARVQPSLSLARSSRA